MLTQPSSITASTLNIHGPVYIYYEIGTGQQWLIVQSKSGEYMIGAVSPEGTLIIIPHKVSYLSAEKGQIIGYFNNGTLQLYRQLPTPYVHNKRIAINQLQHQ